MDNRIKLRDGRTLGYADLGGLGRQFARSIPSCRPEFYRQEGHLSLFVNHYEAVLSAMVC